MINIFTPSEVFFFPCLHQLEIFHMKARCKLASISNANKNFLTESIIEIHVPVSRIPKQEYLLYNEERRENSLHKKTHIITSFKMRSFLS